jgi:hypothetical protein
LALFKNIRGLADILPYTSGLFIGNGVSLSAIMALPLLREHGLLRANAVIPSVDRPSIFPNRVINVSKR